MIRIVLLSLILLGACSRGETPGNTRSSALFPGETREMREMINSFSARYGVPAPLIHRVVQRESDYRARARNGPYYGLMQILPETARTMGHDGAAEELLDPAVNLTYGVRYLRGAWLLSGGDYDAAVMHYARGYYYEARDRCMLVETGLRNREIARRCR
ncbi:transglycosylase SLT domain-containing protein [Roseisalinus antarcticus]|uniref:Transglycosylase SLT domain protein n=1 Tax=Roseisalinus antarcticus TaxID=254357 RepID=A0A1Y5TTY5_9RHOB|nr:transglycosylase SLT domain-containing protein [Roseisalinus antarcticus]SLN72529.1 Transglycosylase SLT domain protein [Roseisalinus antarcticus]